MISTVSSLPNSCEGLQSVVESRFRQVFFCSLKGEILGWTLFYAAVSSLAFGSGYYHLKPDDNRIAWDSLPVRFSHLSLCFSFRENDWNESSLS
ncbi:hypothetical protein Bca101_057679 [Brassica carinata]